MSGSSRERELLQSTKLMLEDEEAEEESAQLQIKVARLQGALERATIGAESVSGISRGEKNLSSFFAVCFVTLLCRRRSCRRRLRRS